MNIPTKKLLNGFELPVYGFGLWQVGGHREVDASNDAAEIMTIRKAIDLGVTHFDTAELYGNGHAEEILGEAIKGYDRGKLFIATKVKAVNQEHDELIRHFNASMDRLGVDYVDLYMLHSFPGPAISLKTTMEALDELVDSGKLRFIGVSNFSVARLMEAQKYARHKIVCNQVHYNVEFREPESSGLLQYCQDKDVMVVAYRPLNKGTLFEAEIIQEMAAKYQKTPSQVALNWLISQKNVVTISKTSNVEHLVENLGAVGWSMEDADIKKIRAEFPDQKMISDVIPLNHPGGPLD